jgi:hypothetical protein
MLSRAWMLLAAALVSPAWSQEAAAPQKVTPPAFDMHSASIQQIVRNTAATQYAPTQLVEEEQPPRRQPAVVEDPDPLPVTPASSPAAPAPVLPSLWDGALSSLVDSLLGTDEDEDLALEAQYKAWNFCLANNRDKPTDQRNRACQQVIASP